MERSAMKPPRLNLSLFLIVFVSFLFVGNSKDIALAEPLAADRMLVVRVLAAGSLRTAITEIGAAFSQAVNARVESSFGPSGVLRERIEKGEQADLFASADMANPLMLSREAKSGPVVLFARNQLCALVRPGLTVTPDTVLSTMLNPSIKLGTSTPKADPAGDYTWAMFAKADAGRPGSGAVLEAKALQLMGGKNSAPPPPGIDLFAWHLRERHADVFIAYCSAGASFKKDLPAATVVSLPRELATGADYGLTLLPTKNETAATLALFILSQEGQSILARNGFDAPLALREPR
jgi:ABC-type molybdate transport system substrate-binding protein